VSGVDPAHGLAGGEKLAAGTLGERSGPHVDEALVGGAQELARVRAPVLAPEPLPVQEPAARELDRRAAAREPLDRLAVERLVVAQQRTAARFDAERPFGAARQRALAEAVQRGSGLVGPAVADAGLDQLDQGPAVPDDVLVLACVPRGLERLDVATVAVVQQRGKEPVSAEPRALAPVAIVRMAGDVVPVAFRQQKSKSSCA
jgi:hypothetical protein